MCPSAWGLQFSPGLWLAADATYYTGGETSVNGVAGHNVQANSRYGLTFSASFGEGYSVKVAGSTWLTSRSGAKFDTIGVVL
jgi:hypothetical protein